MEKRTPQEMSEEINNLAQTIAGLSSTMRERQSELESSSPSSSLPPTGFRLLSPGEKKLEKMKEEARRLQAERTAAKVAELSDIDGENQRRRFSLLSSEGSEDGIYLNPKTRYSVGSRGPDDNVGSIPVIRSNGRSSLLKPYHLASQHVCIYISVHACIL